MLYIWFPLSTETGSHSSDGTLVTVSGQVQTALLA